MNFITNTQLAKFTYIKILSYFDNESINNINKVYKSI